MRADKAACYRLIQVVVLHQYPYCRVPGCSLISSAGHHAFPRNRLGTAFNPKAVISLCVGHHTFGNFSAHESPELFESVIKSIIGEEYEELRELSLMSVQLRGKDFRRIKAALTMLSKGG